MTNPQLAAVYEKAADVIRLNHHHKGAFYDGMATLTRERSQVAVCSLGALSLVLTGSPQPPADFDDCDPTYQDAVWFLSWRIQSAVVSEDPEERIADWNDQSERTEEEVAAAFESAARDIEFMFAAPALKAVA
ncbi:hypothetical protein ACIQVR_41810 [Streptomyces xanthochromogenes]|uniref:DUF6197 family protein n=1 Tax=Streptomyces xanthochromogenes TaxID=67384 RepID=UPI0038080883